jgi:hypothetical protein
MLVNEYTLKIQFKKVRNVRNINKIPMVGSRPLDFRPGRTYAQNGLYMVFNFSSHAYYIYRGRGAMPWGM